MRGQKRLLEQMLAEQRRHEEEKKEEKIRHQEEVATLRQQLAERPAQQTHVDSARTLTASGSVRAFYSYSTATVIIEL